MSGFEVLVILRIEAVGVEQEEYPQEQSPELSSLGHALSIINDLAELTNQSDVHYILIADGECVAWTIQ